MIRTIGEHRLSNFLLWQSAYAELLFLDTLWPDFGREELVEALESSPQRERRFGARQFGSGGVSVQPSTDPDHAPGFRAIRCNMDWITRPLFGIVLAVIAVARGALGADAISPPVIGAGAASWRRANGTAWCAAAAR